ncbi:MAG TPA: winged helix-turn-helix domain-containing protein [Methanotrichaceae archaeon]|nr:winged helix-turn-helix domain-containing protein [Methanotrichaceae archaeon]HQF17701.1 winged helix-turn-helix domain-containing protein [Methanotrichaceae archaeon]HQI92263.1 winged helix-turn-helix domain-containing protein [Methanotrichaceae archaeon]HQJ29407.1 winged helix-turn-helix domain-containing protein [Methanotrichaceae archaeon]
MASEFQDGKERDDKIVDSLASEKRYAILRHLLSRRMTASELSRVLDLPKSTVHDNLIKLIKINLVRREYGWRRWVYYELTAMGRQVLQSLPDKP